METRLAAPIMTRSSKLELNCGTKLGALVIHKSLAGINTLHKRN